MKAASTDAIPSDGNDGGGGVDNASSTAAVSSNDREGEKDRNGKGEADTTTSTATTTNATVDATTCPSCGKADPEFSKSQRRKRQCDRKCKICVEKLMKEQSTAGSLKGERKTRRGKNSDDDNETGSGKSDDDESDNGDEKNQSDDSSDEEEDETPLSKLANDDNSNYAKKDKYSLKGERQRGDEPQSDSNDSKKNSSNESAKDSDSEGESNAADWSPLQADEDGKHEEDDDGLADTPVNQKNNDTEPNNKNKDEDEQEDEIEDSSAGKKKCAGQIPRLKGMQSDDDLKGAPAGKRSDDKEIPLKNEHANMREGVNGDNEEDSKQGKDRLKDDLEDTPMGKQKIDNEDVSESESNAGNWSPMMSEAEEEVIDGCLENSPAGEGRSGERRNCENIGEDEDDDSLDETPVRKRKYDTRIPRKNARFKMVEGEDEEEEDGLGDCLEDTPADKPKSNERIPRKNIRDKMEMARDKALGNGNNKQKIDKGINRGDDSDDYDENHSLKEESLEELKQEILGRSVSSIYDLHSPAAPSSVSQSKLVMDASTFKDGTTVANHLRQDLTCPICHDRLYNPVSLLCGHSFCRECLDWWLNQKQGENTDSNYEEGDATMANNSSTCPTCREPIPGAFSNDGKPIIKINTALKAVLDTLYGVEMKQRRLAEDRKKLKARGGEMGGLHSRGYEELEPLPEEDELEPLRSGDLKRQRYNDKEKGWISLYSSSGCPGWQQGGYNHGGGMSISIRRNVVLDDSDQRYQLSLGLTKCSYLAKKFNNGASIGAVLDVELCLLAMEEDEVDDSGFPAFVEEGGDDEALICTDNDRVHTCVESSFRFVPMAALGEKKESKFGEVESSEASRVQEVPLTRGMIGRDGSVRFRIDLKKALEGAMLNSEGGGGGDDSANSVGLRIVKMKFRHIDTGTLLELRLPYENDAVKMIKEGGSDDEIEFCGTSKPTTTRNDGSRYLLDDHDGDEEHDGPNEYQEDDFLVNGTQDSEEELNSHEEEEEDDEHGVCLICETGGDLIVCDGGDHDGGCGGSYHVHCIGRSEVPPGDWICESCANGIGIDVGVEGHEWPVDDEGEEEVIEAMPSVQNKPLLIDDSDDDDIVPVQKKKKRKILEVLDSDIGSESEDGSS